jgi:amino acid permease
MAIADDEDIHRQFDVQSPIKYDQVDAEPELTPRRLEPKASVFTTAVNMVSNVVGGGILSMPMAFAEMSIFPGIVVLAIMGAVSAHAMFLLVLCATRTGKFTYKELLGASFPDFKMIPRLIDVVIGCYTFGILVGYARIIGDSMPDVMRDFLHADGIWVESWFWILCAAAVFFPLSTLRQLSELKISSALGFLSIVYVIAVIVARFFDGTYEESPDRDGLIASDVPWFHLRLQFFSAVPLCSVAFSCHYNVPVFYGEMRARTPFRMMKAVVTTMPLIFVLYLATAMAGVMQFGEARVLQKSHGDIMNNFAADDVPMNIGRLGMFLHFVCVYPIICIACRRSFNCLVFNAPIMPTRVHVIEAFFLVSASCILAYLVPDVSVVFSVNGAAFGLFIVMVLPNLFYLRLIPPPHEAYFGETPSTQDAVLMYPGLGESDVHRSKRVTENAASPDATAEVELCDLTTASHEAFFGQQADRAAVKPIDSSLSGTVSPRASEWESRLLRYARDQHRYLRRTSIFLVGFGCLMSIVSLVVTIIRLAS